MKEFNDGRPAMPSVGSMIYPENLDRPIYTEPTDRKNFRTFLIPSVQGTEWVAPCDYPGKGDMRLVCYISDEPTAIGFGLRVYRRGDNYLLAKPERFW